MQFWSASRCGAASPPLDRAALRAKARLTFGLDADRPTVAGLRWVAGCSDRSTRPCRVRLVGLLDAGVQVLHAVGPSNTVVVDRRRRRPARTSCVPYLERMDLAYAAADLVLGRSGAMTCAEVAAVGLPAVFVPYPHSNGEQAVNARPLVDVGAGARGRATRTSPRTVVEQLVGELVLDPARLAHDERGGASPRAPVTPTSGSPTWSLAGSGSTMIDERRPRPTGSPLAELGRVHLIGVAGAGMSALTRMLCCARRPGHRERAA